MLKSLNEASDIDDFAAMLDLWDTYAFDWISYNSAPFNIMDQISYAK